MPVVDRNTKTKAAIGQLKATFLLLKTTLSPVANSKPRVMLAIDKTP